MTYGISRGTEFSAEPLTGLRPRTIDGKPLTPGVNVDAVDIEAGIAMARQHGWITNGNDLMLVDYALRRHARGEETGAEKTWMGHFGSHSLTGWRMVLAAALAADARNGAP